MFRVLACLGFLIGIFGQPLFAADIPGGLMRTANSLVPNSYEVMLSPGYLVSPGGSYLSSELRYQPDEEIGIGFGFGSGQVGYNFGVHGIWYIFPDLADQPALAVLGGLYFNRIEEENHFVLRLAPTVSETFLFKWGELSPYGGVQISPSFRLGDARNELSLRANMGTQFIFSALQGLRLGLEAGLGIANSVHEIQFGISYPFQIVDG